MHPPSDEALCLIRRDRPEFLEAVSEAKAHAALVKRSARLALDLDVFEDNPFLLYACLWHACSQGVEVRLCPKRG